MLYTVLSPVLEVLRSMAVGGGLMLVLYVVANFRKKRKPKQYVALPPGGRSNVAANERRVDNLRDSYKLRKVPRGLDAIVVGSGISGLMTAGLLAKAGKRVLVLEQHYIAGGCTHCFDDHGFEFDTGLHYLGEIETFKYLLDKASDPKRKVEWAQMGSEEDGWTCDEIKIGDRPVFNLRRGIRRFKADLIERFPEEKEAIEKIFKMSKQSGTSRLPQMIGKVLPLWVVRLLRPLTKHWGRKWNERTIQEVLDGVTDNAELKALVMGNIGDIGHIPAECPWTQAIGVPFYYAKSGGWYPIGGPSRIAKAIVPVIERAGGRVLVKAMVEQILIDDKTNTAYGVRMAKTGDIIRARQVISAAGVPATYFKLLSEQSAKLEALGIPQTIKDIGAGAAHFYVFVGMRGSSAELKLRSSNIWHWPTDKDLDMNAAVDAMHDDPFNNPLLAFIGSPSAKDPDFDRRFPGKSTAVLITEVAYDKVQQWADQKSGSRDKAYKEFKKRVGDRLLEIFFSYYPQCRDRVEHLEYASPLTNDYYLNAWRGSSYGLAQNLTRFNDPRADDLCRPETPFKNLLLTGQDTLFNGVAAAEASGVITAHLALGYPSVLDVLTMRSLLTDIDTIDGGDDDDDDDNERKED
eukprot:TRINITY_DN57296_c0_g1_i1.p1 TRINITY_DN57296_c0_g1~~TRINITY_DN57296_c0_g1_i1.p1  ORF type:complete len:632 (+),score=354.05 TRINITY_DN57296_c0_g1_i1:39-1934(+)